MIVSFFRLPSGEGGFCVDKRCIFAFFNMKKSLQQLPEFWWAVLLYFLAVEILMVAASPSMAIRPDIIVTRLVFGAVFILLYVLRKGLQYRNFILISTIAVYALLTLLYKETGTLNSMFFSKLDPHLAHIDQLIFGFQPSVVFSEKFQSMPFSELMFFGYFFYYLMPLVIMLLLYRYDLRELKSFGFMLISSFLLYYFIFILLPAEGPQFYFPFPENTVQAQGFFGWAIKRIQHNGEAPTAAFPSSHVGISIMVLIWLWMNKRNWVKYFLPFTLILIFSTVYLKAHYFIDVVAGIFSAPVVFFINFTFLNFIRKQNGHQHQGS